MAISIRSRVPTVSKIRSNWSPNGMLLAQNGKHVHKIASLLDIVNPDQVHRFSAEGKTQYRQPSRQPLMNRLLAQRSAEDAFSRNAEANRPAQSQEFFQ